MNQDAFAYYQDSAAYSFSKAAVEISMKHLAMDKFGICIFWAENVAQDFFQKCHLPVPYLRSCSKASKRMRSVAWDKF